jgi:hypothetical protein
MDDRVPEQRAQLVADLGTELGREMEALSDALDHGGRPDWPAFTKAVHVYLDSLGPDPRPDPYFNWIGRMALPRTATPLGMTGLWEPALAAVIDWESATGRHAHKGSGYYFAGMRDASFGNVDRSFLYMHQAAVEDIYPDRDRIPESPAGWFITLKADRADQAAREIVLRYERYLSARLLEYRNAGRGTLELAELRARYGIHGELFAPVTAIAHVIARLVNVDSARYGPILENRFAPSLRTDLSLDLCLIFEDLLQRRHASELALGGLVAHSPTLGGVSLTTGEVGLLNRRSGTPADFDTLVAELLATGQPSGFPRSLLPRESDVAIALAVRNRAAHGGERPSAAGSRFDEIVPRLFYVIFAALEDLYALPSVPGSE